MKHLKGYKIFESSEEFEPGVDLEYIDIFIEDIRDKGYNVDQYFGFENKSLPGEIYHLDRIYVDNLLMPSRRSSSNEHIYQDYLKGDMSYIIKIYRNIDNDDFPYGEVLYNDVCGALKQLIGYMSEERGLIHYNIKVSKIDPRSKRPSPLIQLGSITKFSNIEDLKGLKNIGCLVIELSKNKNLLVDRHDIFSSGTF